MGVTAGDNDARAFNTLSQWFDRHMTRPWSSNSDASRPVDIARTTRGLPPNLRRAIEVSVGEVGGDRGGFEHSQTLLGHEVGLVIVWVDLMNSSRPLTSSFSSTSRSTPSSVVLPVDSLGDGFDRGGVDRLRSAPSGMERCKDPFRPPCVVGSVARISDRLVKASFEFASKSSGSSERGSCTRSASRTGLVASGTGGGANMVGESASGICRVGLTGGDVVLPKPSFERMGIVERESRFFC
jgi:hypothetical protein